MLTLEFMKNGDLHHLIARLAQTDDSVPQPILWRIFFCRESAFARLFDPVWTLLVLDSPC